MNLEQLINSLEDEIEVLERILSACNDDDSYFYTGKVCMAYDILSKLRLLDLKEVQ